MTPDWLTNPDAVAHIKRLLVQTGAPLESRVARICATTDPWFRQTVFENLAVSRGRFVYGDTLTDSPLREVDHGITIHSMLNVGDDDFFDLSLELQVLIECKHRDGLAVFGFPYESASRRSATAPIICEFAFAPFIQALDQDAPFLRHERICTIGLLDHMQKTPRISDEQLIYKAGASLYDFIRFQSLPLITPYVDPTIQQMGLIEQFKDAVPTPMFEGWSDARRWLRSHITDAVCTDFYARGGGRGAPTPTVSAFVPIVCVDAPLYVNEIDDHGDIQSITPKEYLVSAIRVPKWPSIFHNYLAHSTPEALVIIVNVAHLSAFLERIAAWFSQLGMSLQNIEEHALRKALVEQHMLQSILSTLEHAGRFEDVWRI